MDKKFNQLNQSTHLKAIITSDHKRHFSVFQHFRTFANAQSRSPDPIKNQWGMALTRRIKKLMWRTSWIELCLSLESKLGLELTQIKYPTLHTHQALLMTKLKS